MSRFLPAGAVLVLFAFGCEAPPGESGGKPTPRMNAPVHGATAESRDSSGTFVYMTDNALLADMTVSDRHFMPHRTNLNMVGVGRLLRLAELMKEFGGTIRFNTDLDDADLLAARTETIIGFLADAGVDTTQELVMNDMPGAVGMAAAEAVLISAEVGTYKPGRTGEQTTEPGGR